MTSNSGQRGLLPLSLLAVVLAIALAAYLNFSPSTPVELPSSAPANDSGGEVLVSQLPEDAADSVAESDTSSDSNVGSATDSKSNADNEDPGDGNSEDAGTAADSQNDAESSEGKESDDENSTVEKTDAAGSEADSTDEGDLNSGDEISTDEVVADTTEEPNGAKPEADVILGTYKGMPVGYTEDGLVFRGEPDAPVTIFEYSDYQCPFCLRHFAQTETALNEAYVETGKAKFVFVDFPLVQLHPNAPAASTAALCVAEQDPAAFWEMHSLIFETQNQWSNSPEPLAFFQELGAPLEIDQEAFANCLESGRADAMIERTYAMGRSIGFSGTPSFQFIMDGSDETYDLVGAQPYAKFSSWIDAMAVGEVPVDATQPPSSTAEQGEGNQELPFWATEEGLSPDPDKEGFTMAGDPYRGDVDASIVVIEYSDFQCPFCRRHTVETQPLLDEQFVDTGQVRWIFRHFPLNIHPQAPMAGVAAECAGEQGQFWEMHEILFSDVGSWSLSDPNPQLEALATELGLDVDAFATCLADESVMARIESDFADGRPFVQGTPTFIILHNGQGRLIPGALPADTFAQAIQQVIDTAQ